MCDPLSIAGAALSIGGMVAQNQGAKAAVSAREGVMNAEAARQAAIRDQQKATFDTSLNQLDQPAQQADLKKNQDARAAAVNSIVTPTNPAVPVTGSAPTIVKSTIAKALSDALAYGKKQGIAQGNLAGYGDLNFDNGVNLARSGIRQAQLGNFSAGSSAVVPSELEAANRKGAGMRSFGQVLSGAGQLAGLGGAMGMGPSWGSLFGPSEAQAGRAALRVNPGYMGIY